MKKKILILIVFLLVLSIGCVENKNNIVEEPSISASGADREIIHRSESISDVVVELYGVDDATTVILNDIALVGIALSYDNKLNDEMRSTITDVVKGFDSQISEVKITQDNKLFMQIDDIMNQLILGKSYDNYIDGIHRISQRIR